MPKDITVSKLNQFIRFGFRFEVYVHLNRSKHSVQQTDINKRIENPKYIEFLKANKWLICT